MGKKLQELREKMNGEVMAARAVIEKVKKEDRDWTEEETKKIEDHHKKAADFEKEIVALEEKEKKEEEVSEEKKSLEDKLEKQFHFLNTEPDKTKTRTINGVSKNEHCGIQLRDSNFPDANAKIEEIEKIDAFTRAMTGDATAAHELRLISPTGQGGGVPIPKSIVTEFMSAIEEISALRKICIVRNFAGAEIHVPSATILNTQDVSNANAKIQTNNQTIFADKKLTTTAHGVKIEFQINALPEEIVPMLLDMMTKSLYYSEEKANLKSLLSQLGQKNKLTAAGGEVTHEELVKFRGKAKAASRPRSTFLIGTQMEENLYLLKDKNDRPLYSELSMLTGNISLWGRPVETSDFLDEQGNDKLRILYGDFNDVIIYQKGDLFMKAIDQEPATRRAMGYVTWLESGIIIAKENAINALLVK